MKKPKILVNNQRYFIDINSVDMNGAWTFTIAGKGSDEPQIKIKSTFVHDGFTVINCNKKELKEIRKAIKEQLRLML